MMFLSPATAHLRITANEIEHFWGDLLSEEQAAFTLAFF
jgi:hypothetical protein